MEKLKELINKYKLKKDNVYIRDKDTNKFKKMSDGFLNQLKVKQLLRKIKKWGGVPKAWSAHNKYINAWCKQTGTPLFNSLSNFQDHVTAWRDATVGKRKWTQPIYNTSGDKEFSIFNKPKSKS